MEKLAKSLASAVLIAALAGCGISKISCEIETDYEVIERVLNDNGVTNGLPTKTQTQKK